MAEQILHGSNVVTAAEQGRRERVAEGVRCGGLRDACLFYGTFEGALKGLVIHVLDHVKVRIGLTIWIFISSLIALAVGGGHLSLAVEVYSPLNPAHLGPRVPMFTQGVVNEVNSYLMGMGVVGVVSTIAAIYFWRGSRPTEIKTYAVTFLAGVNLMIAAAIPPLFYIGYFVLPKAANAV